MTSFTALTHIAGQAAANALSEHVESVLDPAPVGIGVIEIEDGADRWEVGFHFTDPPDEIALALLAAAHGAAPFVISRLPDVDWVAHVRRELAPVAAGRFFVHGSHDADKVPEGAVALCIEAAMAFGTGHHGTTLGCLKVIDRLADAPGFDPHRIADIGCGTAVLAMAAARVWPHLVLAGDNDPVAVDTARANVLSNGLAGRVEVVEAAGFRHPVLEEAAPFDLVLANILMQPLIDLAPDMAANLRPGGVAVLSGLLTGQADAVATAYGDHGFALRRRDDVGDWATLELVREPVGG